MFFCVALPQEAMSKSKLPLVGIIGGTFDPIHYGHLRVAEEIIEAIGLQKMYFIPAGVPPLRHAPIASPQHRAEIVRIAIQDNSRFVLDEREINRGGISYSIDSLYELKQELGKEIVLCFVIGVDAFIKLDEWNNWHELFNLCHFIIAARPGHVLTSNHDVLPKELKDECSRRWVSSVDSLRNTTSGLIFVVPTTMLDISATVIRARIAAGKSVRYLIPDAALNHIAASKLYI